MRRYRKSILVLGSGPSAAYAVQALKDLGEDFVVMSSGMPRTENVGAMWLHWLPESVTDAFTEPMNILVKGIGDADTYERKQWGKVYGNSSFPEKTQIQRGHHPELYLKRMWQGVEVELIRKLTDRDIKLLANQYRLIFNSYATEQSLEELSSYRVFIPVVSYSYYELDKLIAEHPELVHEECDAFCIYSGTEKQSWVRMSLIGGILHYEYPADVLITRAVYQRWVPDLVPDTPKWEHRIAPNVIQIGRYGTWDRHYLSHKAYFDTSSAVNEITMN